MMNAVCQRPGVEALVAAKRPDGAIRYEDVGALKDAVIEVLAPQGTAIQVDPIYAFPYAYHRLDPTKGLIVAVEAGDAVTTDGEKTNHLIDGWSVEQAKRLGADAVKLTVWIRMDSSAKTLNHQLELVKTVGRECAKHDIAFLICPCGYELPSDADKGGLSDEDYIEIQLAAITELSKDIYGIDLFQLESPCPAHLLVDPDSTEQQATETQKIFNRIDASVTRPWVVMSAGSGQDVYRRTITYATRAGASGYLAGRAVWGGGAAHYPDLAAVKAELHHSGVPFVAEISELVKSEAQPWHKKLGGTDGVAMKYATASFATDYRFD